MNKFQLGTKKTIKNNNIIKLKHVLNYVKYYFRHSKFNYYENENKN